MESIAIPILYTDTSCYYGLTVHDMPGDNYIAMVAPIAHITIHICMVTIPTPCK